APRGVRGAGRGDSVGARRPPSSRADPRRRLTQVRPAPREEVALTHPALALVLGLVVAVSPTPAPADEVPPSDAPAAAVAPQGPAVEPPAPTPDAEFRLGSGGFMRDHGWRLLQSAGIAWAATYYRREVGPSRKPLLFDETPGFDNAIRNTF